VRLIFNTGLNRTWPPRFEIPACVKDYQIMVWHNGKWRMAVEEQDNIFRKRIHALNYTSKKLKINILKTHGDASAQVFETRVY